MVNNITRKVHGNCCGKCKYYNLLNKSMQEDINRGLTLSILDDWLFGSFLRVRTVIYLRFSDSLNLSGQSSSVSGLGALWRQICYQHITITIVSKVYIHFFSFFTNIIYIISYYFILSHEIDIFNNKILTKKSFGRSVQITLIQQIQIIIEQSTLYK